MNQIYLYWERRFINKHLEEISNWFGGLTDQKAKNSAKITSKSYCINKVPASHSTSGDRF